MKIDFKYSGERSAHIAHTTFNTLETTLFGLRGSSPTFYQVLTSFPNVPKCNGEICILPERHNVSAQTTRRIETTADPKDLLRTHFSIVEYLRAGIMPEDTDLARMLDNPEYKIE